MGKELFKHMRKREYPCVCCKKRTNQRDRRTVTAAQRLVLQKWTVGDVSEDEVLCSLCRVKVHSHLKRRKSEQQNLEHELRDTAPFSPPERKQINARNAAIHKTSTLNRTSIVDMLMYLREIALLNGGKRIDFDDPNALSDQEYVNLTGINKVSFDDLLSAVDGKKGEKQMSTADANTSRLVTKIRWVVESANARIKRWKFFDRVLPSSQVPFISDFIKIVCGISNKYFPPLSTGCTEEDSLVAAKMQYLSRQINQLKEEVEERKLDTRSAIWKHPDELQDFPPILCPVPVENVVLSSTCSRKIGDSCSFSCTQGLLFTTLDNIVCTSDGTWDLNPTTLCLQKAALYLQVRSKRVKRDINDECAEAGDCSNEEIREIGVTDVCAWMKNRLCSQLNCQPGFICVTTVKDCANLNYYRVACQEILCPVPVGNAVLSSTGSRKSGVSCSFSCTEGHLSTTLDNIRCTSKGTWNLNSTTFYLRKI
uniref:Sushi domain-containing protein n=1 Tax=Magallana gigas TaxID=29159 RepID=A0A8W8JJ17_MAGGI